VKRYRSHKIVEAARITGQSDGDGVSIPLGHVAVHTENDGTFVLPAGRAPMVGRAIGGYVIRYSDGYLSWSPAKPFEDGYTEVSE